jgi:flagellar motor switch protein FliM
LANILSQEEVDALLRGIAGGDVETAADEAFDPSGVMVYDLASQDRIIRGRMPTFEKTNEKFARVFRSTLSGILRKVISISAMHTDMLRFGEFLKILPVPTSMHLFKIEPLRGTALIIVESKIIFMLVDVIFGGSGKESFKVEGREFTAIENNIIKKIVVAALADLEKVWQPLLEIKTSYQRSEVNPQFAQIVSPTEVVVVANFEVEIEYSSGMISMCIPYAMLEPIKEKLQAGFQSEQIDQDQAWSGRFRRNMIDSPVDLSVELGSATVLMKDVLHLKKGDVIPLDQYTSEPLKLSVEGVPKLSCYPGIYKGNQAVRIVGLDKENSLEV